MQQSDMNDYQNAWREILTVHNIEQYVEAGQTLLTYLQVLDKEQPREIVIPSRGAYPFFDIATKAWIFESHKHIESNERIAERIRFIESPLGRELTLPFSADPGNIEGITSAQIRHFWVKVLKAIVERNGRNEHLLFYRFLIEKVAAQKWEMALPRRLPNSNFIFVDTVVSGQAICELVNAFESEGINKCHYLLIVDNNGNSIKGMYRKKIDELVAQKRCDLIHVDSLFTEDRGPAVSGIWSTVYPDLMLALSKRYRWGKECVGAGAWHVKVRNDDGANKPVTYSSGILSTTFFTGISMPTGDQRREIIDCMLNKLVECQKSYGPYDRATTLNIAGPRISKSHPPYRSIEVSGSHLLRVYFGDAQCNYLLDEFERDYLNSGLDAFTTTSDWFVRTAPSQ